VSQAVQSTFAQLQQTHPLVSPLYRNQRLWDAAPADAATLELRDALSATLQKQRGEAVARIARVGIIAPLIRWLLTIGAVLWFPLIQPVLEVILRDGYIQSTKAAIVLAVQLLSSAYLLKSAGFLAIWFLFLWLVLRWDTYRKVAWLLTRWRTFDESSRDTGMNTAAAGLGVGRRAPGPDPHRPRAGGSADQTRRRAPENRHGRGVIEPSTTGRLAPVTRGTFDGTPSSVAAPSSAKATASLASIGIDNSCDVRTMSRM
jgi:hypothetical protein